VQQHYGLSCSAPGIGSRCQHRPISRDSAQGEFAPLVRQEGGLLTISSIPELMKSGTIHHTRSSELNRALLIPSLDIA
jgi:hypothetical protein